MSQVLRTTPRGGTRQRETQCPNNDGAQLHSTCQKISFSQGTPQQPCTYIPSKELRPWGGDGTQGPCSTINTHQHPKPALVLGRGGIRGFAGSVVGSTSQSLPISRTIKHL